MVEYLQTVRNIQDPIVEDGTTGFAMALATQNLQLIRILMSSRHPCDIESRDLAKRALTELDRGNMYPSLRKELVNGLGYLSSNAQKHGRMMISKQ